MATSIDPEAVNAVEADKISLKRSLTLFMTWLKDHKYTTTSSVVMEGQKGSREASGLEILIQGVVQVGVSLGSSLTSWVTGGGSNGVGSLMPGDSIGTQPDVVPAPAGGYTDTTTGIFYPEGTPSPNPLAGQEYIVAGPVRSTLTSIGNKISDTVNSFKLSGSTSLTDAVDAPTVGSTVFQNPLTSSFAESNATLAETDNIKAGLSGTWTAAKEKFQAFTDSLSGVTVGTNGYTLGEAFKASSAYVSDKANAFDAGVRSVLGLKEFSVIDFAGSLTDNTLLPTFNAKLKEYNDAKSDPNITPAQLALKEAEVDAAAQALSDQVDQDNANYLEHIAQQSALDSITNTGSTYSDAPDEYKDLYASTLQDPSIATGISSTIDTGKQLQNNAVNPTA